MAYPPPLPAALVGIAGSGGAAAAPSGGGGDPNNVPCARRGTTAVANTVAFFARMDAFACWQEEGCGDNGGGNALVLAACMSRQWTARRDWEGGEGRHSNETAAVLPHDGRAVDNTKR